MSAGAKWTTLLDPALTAAHCVGELHQACFEPPQWPGKGPGVSLLIPECEMQFTFIAEDGEPATVVNRPEHNKDVKAWTIATCREAAENNAFLMLSCDTPEQVEVGARRIKKLLPRYRRVALERMYDPKTRASGALS
jgi:hypothetical protein